MTSKDKINLELFGREHWIKRHDFYKTRYFRLEKCAKIVNSISEKPNCHLLDVGCGPATLSKLLDSNINYYGMDLVIQEPAPNLIEIDITKNEIKYKDKQFDIIVAAGLFEYMGDLQNSKLSEIELLLKKNGKFITTYTNFSHVHKVILPSYNNIKSIDDFRKDLSSFFVVEKYFPSSHNWHPWEPQRRILNKFQMHLNAKIPIFSSLFAVNYFFICSRM